MNQAERDALRAYVADLLAARPVRNRPRHRRQVATFLCELAAEVAPGIGHGHGAPAGCGIRWNGRDLLIGKVLWDAVGQPRHVHFAFSGTTTRIVPDPEGDYTISAGPSRHIGCIRALHIGQWAKGWRPGWIDGGAIYFDIEATEL